MIVFFPTLLFTSCVNSGRINSSFPITNHRANEFLNQIELSHHTLVRPLVIVGGFHDFGLPASSLAKRFRNIFSDCRVLSVSFEGCHTFPECKMRLLSAVNTRFPSSKENTTIPVDVIAVSMGGLVSRYSAISTTKQRLDICRLFTISSPHRGSHLALLPAFEPLQRDMRPNSQFLRDLAHSRPNYEIYSYVRLRDEFVRVADAAPYGYYPWWAPYTGLLSPHNTSYQDSRFIADITARLLGLAPFSTYPPALASLDKPEPEAVATH